MRKWADIFEGSEPKPGGGKLSYDFQAVHGAINTFDPGTAKVHIKYVRQTLQDFRKDLEEIGMATTPFVEVEKYAKHAIEKGRRVL